MRGKPVAPKKKVMGMKVVGKATEKKKKKRPKSLAEHTRSLKSVIKY